MAASSAVDKVSIALPKLPADIDSDYLSKQLSLPPFRSFLRLNFRRVMSYILKDTNSNSIDGQTTSESDIDRLECLIEELRTSFDAICDQDYYDYVKSCDRNKHLAKLDRTNRTMAKNLDCSFILSWGLIETTKYCLTQKLAPEQSTTNQFLRMLKTELERPIYRDNQINRLTLLRFLQYFDRIITDRISESSSRKHTLKVAENVEHFIDANRDTLQTWFSKNRQASARLALMLGDSAECWRTISHRLWNDMATKYSTKNQQSHGSIGSNPSKISVSQTLMSLDTKQWQTNLQLFALAAKDLGDIDLLYGLESLVNYSGLLGDDWGLVKLIRNNMESNYSKNYEHFLTLSKVQPENVADVDQYSLIEFLNSCIELNKLDVHSDKISLLKSSNLKSLYEQYLKSKAAGISRDLARSQFERVKNWITTWSFEPQSSDNSTESISAYTNLIIPTLTNIACRVECATEAESMIKEIRNVIKHESTGRFLLRLDGYTDDIESFEKFFSLIDEKKMQSNTNDTNVDLKHHKAKQNQLIHRLIIESGICDKSAIRVDRKKADLIQFEAAKFNHKINKDYSSKLARDLYLGHPDDDWLRYQNNLLLLDTTSSGKDLASYHSLAEQVSSSTSLDVRRKNLLLSKILSRLWCETQTNIEDLSKLLESVYGKSVETSSPGMSNDPKHVTVMEQIIEKKDLPVKTLVIIAKTLNAQLNQSSNSELMNASFKIDLMVLSRTNASDKLDTKQNVIMETAMRILDKIKKYGSTLDDCNLATFSSPAFIDETDFVWFDLKDSIISLITSCHEFPLVWADSLRSIIKRIARTSPESIIFETIVNRLDLSCKLDSEARMYPSHRFTVPTTVLSDHKSIDNCKRQLEFWDDIYQGINATDECKSDIWSSQVQNTEAFVKEIRKISYLPGEYLESLTIRMNRRLCQFFNLCKKHANPKTGLIMNQKYLDECKLKLNAIHKHESRSIEVLKGYLERFETRSPSAPSKTIYDSCLSSVLTPLKELEYRFMLLVSRKIPPVGELEVRLKSILDLLASCRAQVINIHRPFEQKLYMEQISPFLSRLKPNLVLMPGYYMAGPGQGHNLMFRKGYHPAPVTIHKISQSVQKIHSKTGPKKLVFIGSDGYSRSYLLKAHEDLRLDKLIMGLFGSINLLLGGRKDIREFKYKLQRYSVTPVSTRSGLIQWIDAPSLWSFYRSWFQSTNGRRLVGQLYKETCPVVCPDPAEPDTEKHNCVVKSPNRVIDLFYQLLWSKIRSSPQGLVQATQSDLQPIARPSSDTTLKYRREYPASIYEEVVERLVAVLPQELITHQLWFDSPNSMGYYLRTREFIRSCATISMVGYVIGLGDRHPDNILLDSRTGQVIHIDYSVCFEAGHQLSIAEQVPFRLTQSMIHAFGFAGLEGGFKRSCERILSFMKEYKSTFLHHLDPINLSFMIEGSGAGVGSVDDTVSSEMLKVTIDNDQAHRPSDGLTTTPLSDAAFRRAVSDVTLVSKRAQSTSKKASELNLCSQEEDASVSASASLDLVTNHQHDHHRGDLAAMRPLDGSSSNKLSHNQKTSDQLLSNEIQFDIKTPTMITPKRANDIYARLRSKLSGSDQFWLYKTHELRAQTSGTTLSVDDKSYSNFASRQAAGDRPSQTDKTSDGDLILLIDEIQSTEDQVNALILEAISNKNKAAMFEGWSPWI